MSAGGFDPNAGFSVFEGLHAGPDEALDRLAFATYSLDLVTIVALVLALSGDGEAELDAGPLRLLEALDTVLPRIDVVHQKDKLRAALRHHHVLHLLDGRIHSVQPPKGCSFHPKLALARYLSRGGKPAWRLWIGSRNLTAGEDREAGLLLCGALGGARGTRLPAVAEMAAGLLAPVHWIRAHRSELVSIRWAAPEGTRLLSLQWRMAGATSRFKLGAARSSRVLAISPFVDLAGCGHAFHGAPTQRLLTTRDAAAQLGVSDQIDIHVAGAPDLQAAHGLGSAVEADEDGPEPIPVAGLHAKLLIYDAGGPGRLFIGSANLTRRGLIGSNAELLAELEVPDTTVSALHDLACCHPLVAPTGPDPHLAAALAAERALDAALETVLAARLALRFDNTGATLSTTDDLDKFLQDHTLVCWLLTCPDNRSTWPFGAKGVQLTSATLPLRLHTVLVCFSAAPSSGACPPRSWAQVVDCPGFDREARDLAAKAEYARMAGASAWLRGQLEGILPPETGSWSSLLRGRRARAAGSSETLPLSLEEVLGAWARNPEAFEAKVEPVDAMLQALSAAAAEHEPAEAQVGDSAWQSIEAFWRAIKDSLVGVPR